MRKYGLLLLPLIVFYGLCAQAGVLDLYVQERIIVYAKPTWQAKRISALDPGDRVVISPKAYNKGRWRKILITYQGRKRAAYIPSASLRLSIIKARAQGQKRGAGILLDSYAIGTGLSGSFMQQQSRKVTTSAEESYDISPFESTTFFVSLHVEIPMSPQWGVRPFLTLRETAFQGRAQSLESLSAATADVELIQKFIGLGTLFKFYPKPYGIYWYGFGLELARGTSVDLTLGESVLDTDNEDLPFFYMLQLHTGWDLAIFDSAFIVPELKAGIAGNTDPMVYNVGLQISLTYKMD